MPVTEALMQAGSWTLRLRDTTPWTLLERLKFWSALIVTPLHVPDPGLDAADLLAVAQFTGVLRRRSSDRLDIGGAGIAVYLGNESGYGPNVTSITSASDFGTWLAANLPKNGLALGSASTEVGSVNEFDAAGKSFRRAMDELARITGNEWRVTPKGEVDWGTALFRSSPYVVVTRDPGRAEHVSTSTGLHGVQALSFDAPADIESAAFGWRARTSDGAYTVSVASPFPYYDDDGTDEPANFADQLTDSTPDLIYLPGHSTVSSTDSTDLSGEVAGRRVENERIRRAITVKVNQPVNHSVVAACGDHVWVYDPATRLYDLDNHEDFRGEPIFPLAARLSQWTWPIQRGHGVYLVDLDSASSSVLGVTDLTDYVEFEPATATWRLDGKSRSVIPA